VQAQCEFESGELRCVFVEAQPLRRVEGQAMSAKNNTWRSFQSTFCVWQTGDGRNRQTLIDVSGESCFAPTPEQLRQIADELMMMAWRIDGKTDAE
jgi:hypothetical protein